MLNICEIFTSIQGESTLAGYLCTFVRLSGCNLRCAWCDTRYSYDNANGDGGGVLMSIDDIVAQVSKTPVELIEITGGEPLLQTDVTALCRELLRLNYKVMIETNGTQNIKTIPQEVRRIIDIKCPDSGHGGSFLADNLKYMTPNDEIKFVLASIDDAVWAKNFCDTHKLLSKCPVTFSPVSRTLPLGRLAGWMAENHVFGIRLGLQLHKVIWGDKRGV
ncbi:MAG: radical SAM protein [Chitinispirillales bacterium]|jgi:7-carboxy-7-deazaguanine synthase|nr:radical SAM protein [Chitinispirillales bacterium]